MEFEICNINVFRSTMGEDRFNALILTYVNVQIDIEEIIDIFATKHGTFVSIIVFV